MDNFEAVEGSGDPGAMKGSGDPGVMKGGGDKLPVSSSTEEGGTEVTIGEECRNGEVAGVAVCQPLSASGEEGGLKSAGIGEHLVNDLSNRLDRCGVDNKEGVMDDGTSSLHSPSSQVIMLSG